MVGGVIADDIHDGRRGFARVMEVRESIGQPRPEMEQRGCRLVCHPCVTVRRPGHDTLEQTENASHPVHPIKSGNEVHFGRPWVGETHVNATSDEGPYQTFSTIHDELIRLT